MTLFPIASLLVRGAQRFLVTVPLPEPCPAPGLHTPTCSQRRPKETMPRRRTALPLRALAGAATLALAVALHAAGAAAQPCVPGAAGLPTVDEITPGTVRVLQPGGATGCMFGDPFQFVVKRSVSANSRVHIVSFAGRRRPTPRPARVRPRQARRADPPSPNIPPHLLLMASRTRAGVPRRRRVLGRAVQRQGLVGRHRRPDSGGRLRAAAPARRQRRVRRRHRPV